VVGIMLISAMLILPASTALQMAKGFKAAMITAASIAVFSVLAGITVSFYADLPTGATVVIINFLLFALSFPIKKMSDSGRAGSHSKLMRNKEVASSLPP
jgi:zinc transport system permease protein